MSLESFGSCIDYWIVMIHLAFCKYLLLMGFSPLPILTQSNDKRIGYVKFNLRTNINIVIIIFLTFLFASTLLNLLLMVDRHRINQSYRFIYRYVKFLYLKNQYLFMLDKDLYVFVLRLYYAERNLFLLVEACFYQEF
jgi:hypothetical protein